MPAPKPDLALTDATRLLLDSIAADFADSSSIVSLKIDWVPENARWEWAYDAGGLLFWGHITNGVVYPEDYG